MTPLSVTLLLTIAVLVWFFVVGVRAGASAKDYKGFFLANREVGSAEYTVTMTAATTSLATVLMWFILFGRQEGLFLLWAPFTVFIGAIFLSFVMSRLAANDYLTRDTSMYSYCLRVFGSRPLATLITIMSMISLFFILLIELYVGIQIFGVFLEDSSLVVNVLIGFLLLIVFSYSSIGGFPGVLQTDRRQFAIMVSLSVIVPLILAINSPEEIGSLNWIPHEALSSEYIFLPTSLAMYLLIVNLLYLPAQLRVWQVAAATRDKTALVKGAMRSAVALFVIWGLFIFIGVLSAAYVPESDAGYVDILNGLRTSGSAWVSYGAFPLLFVGSVAALVSTADSAILPIVQVIVDGMPERMRTINKARITIFVLMFICYAGYYYFFILQKFDIVGFLFATFGYFILLAPPLLASVFWRRHVRSTGAHIAMGLGILVGGAIVTYFSFVGKGLLGNDLYVPVVGVSIVASFTFVGFFVPKVEEG